MYEYLARPISVGQMELKNRIIMPAIHHLYTENGLPTARFTEYYRARALGGAAMIITGACRFDGYGAHDTTMSLCSDECIAPWRAFTDEMHAVSDCRIAVQLYHAGRYMRRCDVPAYDEAIAPSAVYTPFTRETARAMTEDDILRVISDWAAAARRAKEAGFDAVEISASAGYLMAQFLSPLANIRTDRYGGSFENRCRFPLEVLDAVRDSIGSSYPLLLRLGGNDLVPGSNGSEECLKFACLAAERVDLLDMTGGWHESRTPQLTGEVPPAGLVHLAQSVKANVSVPVAMANRMGDQRTAEIQLALGRCDLIAMGRPLIADPELPNKLLYGGCGAVRPCAACNQGCLAGTFFARPVRCLVNPNAGLEYLSGQKKRSENVLVVGGGPAGCEAALRLANAGCRVTLREKSSVLGGQLAMAASLPARENFARLIDYYGSEMQRLGIAVELGAEADADSILAGGFDRVVLATGRVRRACPVPAAEDAVPVYSVERFFAEKPVLGKRVAVIGGSFVGLEIARTVLYEASVSPERLHYLMRYGVEPAPVLERMLSISDRSVAIFDKGKVGAGYEPGIAWPVMADLSRFKAEIYRDTTVLSVSSKGIVTEKFVWPCDAVICAAGLDADDTLFNALRGKIPVSVIGNAARLGRAIDAISSARNAV